MGTFEELFLPLGNRRLRHLKLTRDLNLSHLSAQNCSVGRLQAEYLAKSGVHPCNVVPRQPTELCDQKTLEQRLEF